MSAPAAFKATYSDLKFIKSRKVAQVMLELPIEQADAFVKAFGTPNPVAETWVGIARLDLSAVGGAEPEKEKRHFSELRPSQRAALLCKTVAFQKFNGEENAESMASRLRYLCNVASRSELDSNKQALRIFEGIEEDYSDWLNGPVV